MQRRSGNAFLDHSIQICVKKEKDQRLFSFLHYRLCCCRVRRRKRGENSKQPQTTDRSSHFLPEGCTSDVVGPFFMYPTNPKSRKQESSEVNSPTDLTKPRLLHDFVTHLNRREALASFAKDFTVGSTRGGLMRVSSLQSSFLHPDRIM